MKATELVNKAIDIAKSDKMLYVMGCFGASLTAANKKRYTINYSYNKAAARVKMTNVASEGTFGFDCVCFIRGIPWGRCGDKGKTYGGAKYVSNDAFDIGADQTIIKCSDAPTTGWADMESSEVVWITGYIGIYIDDGPTVECTLKWKSRVQIIAVGNIGSKAGYNTRTWKKHGHIPYVEYPGKVDILAAVPDRKPSTPIAGKEVKGTGVVIKFNKSLARAYTVTARNGPNARNTAGTSQDILVSIPKGMKVQNYGYYTPLGGVDWLYVKFTYRGMTYTGFCSAVHLKE